MCCSPPRAPLRCALRTRDSRLRVRMFGSGGSQAPAHRPRLTGPGSAPVCLAAAAHRFQLTGSGSQAPAHRLRLAGSAVMLGSPRLRLVSPAASCSAKRRDGGHPRAPPGCAPVCSAPPRLPAPRLYVRRRRCQPPRSRFIRWRSSAGVPVLPQRQVSIWHPSADAFSFLSVRSARSASTGFATPAWRPSG